MKRTVLDRVAGDLRQRAAKDPKQYIVHIAGCGAAITFARAEETRVRAQASRLGISVEELIARAVNRRLSKSRRPVDEVIASTVKTLGAPSKKRKVS